MKAAYPIHNLSDDDFIKILIQKIKEKKPLSFTRFGDGEIYFINNSIPKIIEDQLKTTWGYSNIDDAKKDVLLILNKGLHDSDIIGLMNPMNDISKNMLFSYETWSIPLNYLNTVRKKPLLIADHMITRGKVLGDIFKFKDIIQGNDIAIISPRVNQLKENNIDKILGVNINYIEVPMGMNLKNRVEVFNQLNNINEHIILYGCSINGKDFGSYLSNRGKIALDFGATLDAWAGLITRKWFGKNGIQNYCLIKNNK